MTESNPRPGMHEALTEAGWSGSDELLGLVYTHPDSPCRIAVSAYTKDTFIQHRPGSWWETLAKFDRDCPDGIVTAAALAVATPPDVMAELGSTSPPAS